MRADWPDVAVEATPAAVFAHREFDLAVIPTPDDSQFPLARMALAAGKHVVVDKRFTVTLAEARCQLQIGDAVGHSVDFPNTTCRAVSLAHALNPISQHRAVAAARAAWASSALAASCWGLSD